MVFYYFILDSSYPKIAHTHGTHRLAEWADSPYPWMWWKWSIFELGASRNLNIYARAATRKISHTSEWNIFHIFHFPYSTIRAYRTYEFRDRNSFIFCTRFFMLLHHWASRRTDNAVSGAFRMKKTWYHESGYDESRFGMRLPETPVVCSDTYQTGMFWYITGWFVSKHSR